MARPLPLPWKWLYRPLAADKHKLNQMLIVKNSDEMNKALGNKEFLAKFGLKIEDGDKLSSGQNTEGLVALLNNPNTIVVFSMENFGQFKNRLTDSGFIHSIHNQDVVRFDEFHLPFSERTTYITSEGKKMAG